MSSPTNTRWARLKCVVRYLVKKRISIWKFEPTASEARDNELTATSDSDWGGCVKTRKSTTGTLLRHAGSTTETMSRTQASVGLSSAEAECCGMGSALAEAKLVQQILGEYHEDAHIILETDSSAAKANAERPGCGRMKHISVKVQVLARRDHETRSMVAKSGNETQCCRRLDKDSESTSAKEHVDFTENRAVGTYLRTSVHKFDRGQKYPERADG